MNVRLTSMAVGIAMVVLIAGIFGMYYLELGTRYNVQTDATSVAMFNRSEQLQQDMKEIEGGIMNASADPSLWDQLGGIATKVYSSVKLMTHSVSYVKDMTIGSGKTPGALDYLYLGQTRTYFQSFIIILLIIIVISVLIYLAFRVRA